MRIPIISRKMFNFARKIERYGNKLFDKKEGDNEDQDA